MLASLMTVIKSLWIGTPVYLWIACLAWVAVLSWFLDELVVVPSPTPGSLWFGFSKMLR